MKMILIYLVLAVGTISLPAWGDSEFSSEQIRELVKQGKILPLDTILARHQTLTNGRLLDLEVEVEHGRIIYEMEFLRKNGDVIELTIDAKTGELLEQEID